MPGKPASSIRTKTQRALETIERNVKLQNQLIDDLLDVARILRGKLKLDLASVDLAAAIESAIEVVQTPPKPNPSPCTRPSSIPARPEATPDALQQIIWNLLSNAIKFTPSGGRVELRLEQVAAREHGSEGAREREWLR